VYYEEEVAAKEEDTKKEESAVDADGNPVPAKPKKKVIRKIDLPFITGTTSLDPSVVNTLMEAESQMHAADKLVTDTLDRMNALEEYIYNMRERLDGTYAPFVQPAEKEALFKILQESENWLYSDEGQESTKSAYVTRLDAAKKLGDPIAARHKEFETRASAASELRATINEYLAQANSEDEKYAHIEAKDKQSVVEKCATVEKWLDDQLARQAERPKNVDPVITCADIIKKKDEIIYFAIPILNKPKPKPKVEPSATGTETPKSRKDTPTPDATQQGKQEEMDVEQPQGPTEMDVD